MTSKIFFCIDVEATSEVREKLSTVDMLATAYTNKKKEPSSEIHSSH